MLTSVGKLTIPTNKFKCSQDYIVPGFNEHLKELHCDARAQYLIWRNDGKPRTGESHEICEIVGSALSMHFVNAVLMKR